MFRDRSQSRCRMSPAASYQPATVVQTVRGDESRFSEFQPGSDTNGFVWQWDGEERAGKPRELERGGHDIGQSDGTTGSGTIQKFFAPRTSRPVRGANEGGYAEQLGREFGPYVANALYAVTVGRVAQAYGLGTAAIGTVVTYEAATGLLGTDVGELGADAGAAYGHYIDRTGHNPFYPDMNSGYSPREDMSVWDSIVEAYDKLMSDGTTTEKSP